MKKKKKRAAVSTLALDGRSRKAFEIFFKSHCGEKYCLGDDHQESNLTIVNWDSYGGLAELEQFFSEYGNRPIIALAFSNWGDVSEGIYVLRKPVNHKALSDLLHQIETGTAKSGAAKTAAQAVDIAPVSRINQQKLSKAKRAAKQDLALKKDNSVKSKKTQTPKKSSKETLGWQSSAKAARIMSPEDERDFVGSQADIDINRPREVLKITYNPDVMLVGAIKRAWELSQKQNNLLEVTFLGISAVVDAQQYQVFTCASDGVIRPSCLLESDDIPAFEKVPESFRSDKSAYLLRHGTKKLHQYDIEAFLWKIGLWSSRGRIPVNASLNTPVFLSEWPNLTRLIPIPHAVRISALLSQQPQRLPDIATQLRIPQRFVFAYYSAAYTLGISGVSKRQSDPLLSPEVKKTSHSKQLLGKLLGRLTGALSITAAKSRST